MSQDKRIWIPFAGAVLLLVLTVGYRLHEGSLELPGQPDAPAAPPLTLNLEPNLTQGGTDDEITRLQERLKKFANDERSYVQLAADYLQKVRESGDPSYYPKAEAALRQALELQADDADAVAMLGSLDLGRHQFREALDWGQKAIQLNPNRAFYWGVITDAQVELGQYPEAVESVQKMLDIRPDLSSYARTSYIRELHGDMPGAIEAMTLAVDAGRPTGENTAWTRVQLGNLYFNTGDLKSAEREYQHALASFPDYVYAQAGLAQVQAARGQYDQAIAQYERIVQRLPLAQFATALGDLYAVTGQKAQAERQYGLVQVQDQLLQANGVVTDMEMALFLADHGSDPQAAVKRAQAAINDRPSVYAADALAWAFYRASQYREAREASQQALRLKTQDALLFYHAGMIAYKLGDIEQARIDLKQALGLNPYFSVLYAPEARQTLAALGDLVPAATEGGD